MTSAVPRAAEHAAARRAVARRLHPDLGGDVEEYLAAMARVDQQFGAAGHTTPPGTQGEVPTVLHRGSPLGSVRKRTRAAVRTVQHALPHGWPGSRRYGQL